MGLKWLKKPVYWEKDHVLYVSIPFTWSLLDVKKTVSRKGLFNRSIVVGGPGIYLMPNYFRDIEYVKVGRSMPGILQKVNSLATRTTTGCSRRCKFCGVRIFEGGFKELSDWPDLPIICDNNLLLSSQKHFDKVIDRLIKWRWADFNQGVDCRLLTDHHAKRFSEIKKPMIRLALDDVVYFEEWELAFGKLRSAGIVKANIRSYALIGFNSDPSEAWERCRWIEKHGIMPLPMWYHTLDALKKNQVTEEQKKLGWSDFERRKIMKFFYHHTLVNE